jgi:hypothetical protein
MGFLKAYLLKDEANKKINILSKKIKEIYELLEKDDN